MPDSDNYKDIKQWQTKVKVTISKRKCLFLNESDQKWQFQNKSDRTITKMADRSFWLHSLLQKYHDRFHYKFFPSCDVPQPPHLTQSHNAQLQLAHLLWQWRQDSYTRQTVTSSTAKYLVVAPGSHRCSDGGQETYLQNVVTDVWRKFYITKY